MRRLFFLTVCFCLMLITSSLAATPLTEAPSQALPLSPQAQISLLTCTPTDDDLYTLYGHTAIRIYDPVNEMDIIFNYGIFDSFNPYFIFLFAAGKTDYMVRSSHFEHYLMEYISRGSGVSEQILNFLPEEKEALWQALVLNERPENRVYRYNFFFDNCATRPAVMIEKCLTGTVKYPPQPKHRTFREAINYCTRNHPWVTLGCDIIMGTPTDRIMTLKETFFLPAYLHEAVEKAEVARGNAVTPLVIKTNTLNENDRSELSPSFLTSPLACFTLLFILLAALTYSEWRRKKPYRWIDPILFTAASIGGCVVYFLSFISVHPSMFPNISILWLHPFHLAGVIFFSVKKYKTLAFRYHFTNFAVIFIMSVAWFFVPQHFNIALIPLIACFWLRSGWAVFRKKYL